MVGQFSCLNLADLVRVVSSNAENDSVGSLPIMNSLGPVEFGKRAFFWLLAVAGFVSFAVYCSRRGNVNASWYATFPAGLCACWTGTVILHEIGHLIVAKICHLNPCSVMIGCGLPVWEIRFFKIRWVLRTFPINGLVQIAPHRGRPLRWRMILMVSGGPLVNLVVVIVLARLIWQSPDWWISVDPLVCWALNRYT